MILAAAVLVLVALGLFVAGIATGTTAFYWACVAVSALAAVFLFLARRQMGRAPADEVDGPTVQQQSSAVPSATAGTDRPEPLLSPAGEAADGAPAAAETAARHRPREAGDGRVGHLPQGEPAGTVSEATGAGAAENRAGGPAGPPPGAAAPAEDGGDPPVEEVEVTDLLLVVDLRDEVLVVDEHPRYHVAGCPWLADHTAIPLPLDEARTDGFTPCGECAPDRQLAQAERARRAEGRST